MMWRALGLISIYVGIELILRGLGAFPEAWTPEWWAYTLGIGLVISPLYLAYVELKRGADRNGK